MTLSAILAVVLAIQSPQQFDLICENTTRTQSSVMAPETETGTVRVRLDLDRMVFCFDDCENVLAIVAANSSEIILNSKNDAEAVQETSISRVSGEYVGRLSVDMGSYTVQMDTQGQCRPSAYTPIPEARF